jgi:hypothetical protein
MRVLCTCIILFFILLPTHRQTEKANELIFFSLLIAFIIDFSKSNILRYLLITTYCLQVFIVLLFPMIHLLLERLS